MWESGTRSPCSLSNVILSLSQAFFGVATWVATEAGSSLRYKSSCSRFSNAFVRATLEGKVVSGVILIAHLLERKVLHPSSISSHILSLGPFFDALNTMLNAAGPFHSFQRLMLRVSASLRGPQVISLAPTRVRSCLPQTSSRKILHSGRRLVN